MCVILNVSLVRYAEKQQEPLYEGEKEKIKVTEQNLEKFLGKEKYSLIRK